MPLPCLGGPGSGSGPLKGEEHVHQVRRQMRVIDAILESGNYFGQQNLLQHPLIESFLTLKWKKMAPFFYAIVAVHVLFVCALTGLVAQIYWWAGDQGAGVQVARVGVFVTTVIIALQVTEQPTQLYKGHDVVTVMPLGRHDSVPNPRGQRWVVFFLAKVFTRT